MVRSIRIMRKQPEQQLNAVIMEHNIPPFPLLKIIP